MGTLFRVLVSVLIPLCVRSQATTISFIPSTISLTPITVNTGIQITIRCDLTSSVNNLAVMTINEVTESGTTALVTASSIGSADGTANLVGGGLSLTNVSVSGTLTSRSITLVMNEAGCNDGGTYQCFASYLNSASTLQTLTDDKELNVEVGLGQMYIPEESIPFDQTEWKVGNILTMRCTGPVGSVDTSGDNPQPAINWVWEYRNSASQSWFQYSVEQDGSPTDITQGNFVSMANDCYKNQTSTLVRNLTLNDNGREYQCYARRGFSGTDQFAARYSVGVVSVSGTTDGGGDDDDDEPAGASVGPIVGGVFGALIIIAVIIILIYFLVIRPRRRKQAEEGAYPDKGDDSEAVPPYSADPSVLYSQPTRRNKDKRWNGADRRTEGATSASEEEGREVTEGLHYADLDLTRNPPKAKERKNAPVPKQRSANRVPPPTSAAEKEPPTEYASIRLY